MTPDERSETDGAAADESSTDDTADSEGIAGGDLLEGAVMVVSALLLVGLLGYLVSQAIVAPAAPDPTATVESVEAVPAGDERAGAVRATVSLENEGETGLSSVEVVVHCGSTERSLMFTHVPARGHRTGTVLCPAGTTPTASVAAWIEA